MGIPSMGIPSMGIPSRYEHTTYGHRHVELVSGCGLGYRSIFEGLADILNID
jgi:hypothetical protein